MREYLLSLIGLLLICGCGDKEQQLLKKADRIHSSVLTVDTHCDTPMRIGRGTFDIGKKNEDGSVDFPRMIEGGLNAEFFAVYLGQGPRTDEGNERAYRRALEIFNLVHTDFARYPEMAEIALSPDDAYRLRKEGKIAAFIGLENGYPIGNDISRVEEFYNLGMRYITLCHSSNNDICDSSTDRNGPEHGGVSEFGEKVISEMNRLGIMVDVSHISDESFYDVIRLSKAPVIASHSSCRALCESPRNLSDEMLLELRDNGGVIQICILSSYLIPTAPNPELDARVAEIRSRYAAMGELNDEQRRAMSGEVSAARRQLQKIATVKDAVDHIDHVVQVIGIDHVGIGTDFDGGGGIDGCRTVAEVKNITIELVRRGYTRTEIEKIWGGNFMRVFREVERLAQPGV
ncbi:MAG: membrane dipeptidase [Bacteroidetes bacterium]|nr:membrane dipeptidase [Bacteroidota bacterium]